MFIHIFADGVLTAFLIVVVVVVVVVDGVYSL